MSQLERRVEQLEKAHSSEPGTCPHLPFGTRLFEEIAGQQRELLGFYATAQPAPCPCGLPREELHVVMKEVEAPGL